jgi:hypothetical protein
MIKRWPGWTEIKVRLQQVYALMVKPAEPTVKGPSPEEMKADLERELREQMKNRDWKSRPDACPKNKPRLQAERLKEIERIKQDQDDERKSLQKELEEKMLEQMRKSREEEQQRAQVFKEEEQQRAQMFKEEEQQRADVERRGTETRSVA